MATLYTNNAVTTLNGAINDTTTTIVVTDGSVFPNPTGGDYFWLTLTDDTNIEIVQVTARSTNSLTVVRGQDGTSGTAFADGDKAQLRITAIGLSEFAQTNDLNISDWDTAFGWGDHAAAGYLTTATAASTYLPLAGGTLTGSLTLSDDLAGLIHSHSSPAFDWETYQEASGNLVWTISGTGGAEMRLFADGADHDGASTYLQVGDATVATQSWVTNTDVTISGAWNFSDVVDITTGSGYALNLRNTGTTGTTRLGFVDNGGAIQQFRYNWDDDSFEMWISSTNVFDASQTEVEFPGDIIGGGLHMMNRGARAVTNLDTAYTAGPFYYINTATNQPTASTWGQGINIVGNSSDGIHNNSSNWITQLAWDTGGTNFHYRAKTNSGAWSAWHEVWHSGNLDMADYLRSNASDTIDGDLTVGTGSIIVSSDAASAGNFQKIRLGRSTSQYMSFFGDAGGNKMISVSSVGNPKQNVHVGWSDDDGATIGALYTFSGSSGTVWHSGNDGSGSTLDADTVDGIQAVDLFQIGTGSQTVGPSGGGVKYFHTTTGATIRAGGSEISSLQVYQATATADAAITFHVSNDYAGNFGLSGNVNDLVWGGWSVGSVEHRIFHQGNFQSLLLDRANTWNAQQTVENNVVLRGGSPTLYFRDTNHNSAMVHVNSNIFYVLRGGVDTTGWVTHDNGRWPMELGLSASSPYVHFAGVARANGGFEVYTTGGSLMGQITATDTTWTRINQDVVKNIYTPRYIRADNGFFVDGAVMGITGSGYFRPVGGSSSTPGVASVNDTDTGIFWSAANHIQFTTGGTQRGYWNSTSLYAQEVTLTSDIRVKTDIKDNPYGLDAVMRMETHRYKRTDSGRTEIGVIAQELEKIVPELVMDGSEASDLKSVTYPKMAAVFIKAIQELKKELDEVKRGCNCTCNSN